MLVTVFAQVNLDNGGVQWLRRSWQCPAQIAPDKRIEFTNVTLDVRARECVDGRGTVRVLTCPLDGDHFLHRLVESMFERCEAPEGIP